MRASMVGSKDVLMLEERTGNVTLSRKGTRPSTPLSNSWLPNACPCTRYSSKTWVRLVNHKSYICINYGSHSLWNIATGYRALDWNYNYVQAGLNGYKMSYRLAQNGNHCNRSHFYSTEDYDWYQSTGFWDTHVSPYEIEYFVAGLPYKSFNKQIHTGNYGSVWHYQDFFPSRNLLWRATLPRRISAGLISSIVSTIETSTVWVI